jgi:hypothetical protein
MVGFWALTSSPSAAWHTPSRRSLSRDNWTTAYSEYPRMVLLLDWSASTAYMENRKMAMPKQSRWLPTSALNSAGSSESAGVPNSLVCPRRPQLSATRRLLATCPVCQPCQRSAPCRSSVAPLGCHSSPALETPRLPVALVPQSMT